MNAFRIFTFYKFADFEYVLIHLSSSNTSIFIKKSLPGELFSPFYRFFKGSDIYLEEIS